MEKIGIIGFGNMGSAIAQQLASDYKVSVYDKETEKISAAKEVDVAKDILGLVNSVGIIILAVKPQDFENLLLEIKSSVSQKLIISIAAGISTGYIEKVLGVARVIRAMPNMPAKIGEGITCLSKGKFSSEDDFDFAENLFSYLGETLRIDEGMMNAATAVSGSGPGFFCDLVADKPVSEIKTFTEKEFIPALSACASSLGFSSFQAKMLAEMTGCGTVKYLEKGHLSASEVKKQVASKGGTTEAGLAVMQHDVRNLGSAIKAAVKRAEELSKS